MTDKSKRCGTCARWGFRYDVNKTRSCKADFVDMTPGGRFFEREYGPRHVCHRPDDYEPKGES